MWERLRFARYALRFERAFKTDRWEPVLECFHPEARYSCAGARAPYDRDFVGPNDIVGMFRELVDNIDRKYDRRIPKLLSFPRVEAGTLVLRVKATYTSRLGEAVLHDEIRCRFRDGKIIELRDFMDAGELAHWEDLAKQLG